MFIFLSVRDSKLYHEKETIGVVLDHKYYLKNNVHSEKNKNSVAMQAVSRREKKKWNIERRSKPYISLSRDDPKFEIMKGLPCNTLKLFERGEKKSQLKQ